MKFNRIGKRVGKGLAMLLVGAGAVFSPLTSNALQDMVEIQNGITQGVDGRGDELKAVHYGNDSEGYNSIEDHRYIRPSLWASSWGPFIYSQNGTNRLDFDSRSTNSISPFNYKLAVFIANGQNISGTQQIGVKVHDTTIYDGFDPTRHYTLSNSVYGTYIGNGSGPNLSTNINLRDLVTTTNVVFGLAPITNLNILASQTNAQGEVIFGEGSLKCPWNEVVSSSSSGGSNNWNGSKIFNYNSSTSVVHTADPGYYVDKVIETRTDNVGDSSTTTNDLPGNPNSYTTTVNNIKGPNSIQAVFAQSPPSGSTVNLYDSKYGASPTNWTGIPQGGSVTTYVPNVQWINPTNSNVGTKIKGLKKQ